MSTSVPFEWSEAGRSARISRGGTLVTVVGGETGRRLLARPGVSDMSAQALLQRATGNDKRGSER
ncbi:hypothetical protein [Microbacterium sp. ZW T5_56]|uniref:hypothetical protein n=1 Tax=Microbacterium sp. ZW T5_56 TaxID=3378081 RepID=UPI0038524437